MTRLDLLQLVVGRAHAHGFEFRRWYTTRLELPWINADAALRLLDTQRRYYALIFSHEFASAFWKAGTDITFEMPANTFERRMPDGTLRTIHRNPFVRRSARHDVWRYHLRQMALAEEPLRYLRKYLRVEESLDPEPDPRGTKARKRKAAKAPTAPASPLRKAGDKPRPLSPRPLPTEPPAFLQRPYKGLAPVPRIGIPSGKAPHT